MYTPYYRELLNETVRRERMAFEAPTGSRDVAARPAKSAPAPKAGSAAKRGKSPAKGG